MMDKIFLLNSWPFLVKHIQLVIDYLKMKSSAVYNDEIARCPQRTHRIQMSSASTSCGFPRQRGYGGKPTRSLAELTADAQVFERLHRAFTWMLKAGGDRLTEKLLEGPVSEGCVIDLNRLEGGTSVVCSCVIVFTVLLTVSRCFYHFYCEDILFQEARGSFCVCFCVSHCLKQNMSHCNLNHNFDRQCSVLLHFLVCH